MSDERRYLVPSPTAPKLYPSLSGWLQSVAHFGPPLRPGSLPARLTVKPMPLPEEPEVELEVEELLQLSVGGEVEDPWRVDFVVELLDPRQMDLDAEIIDPPTEEPPPMEPDLELYVETELQEDLLRVETETELQEDLFRVETEVESLPILTKDAVRKGRAATKWIEIELSDDQGRPVSGEPFWIQLSDGRTREGKLDDYGRARIEEIASGTCVVKFPNIDASDFKATTGEETPPKVGETDEAETTWFELELLDDTEKPVADEPYWIQLSDGEIREGRLDKNGRLRLENIPVGACALKFPGIDDSDLHQS